MERKRSKERVKGEREREEEGWGSREQQEGRVLGGGLLVTGHTFRAGKHRMNRVGCHPMTQSGPGQPWTWASCSCLLFSKPCSKSGTLLGSSIKQHHTVIFQPLGRCLHKWPVWHPLIPHLQA